METQTFTAGAAVRHRMRVWIAELDLDAQEFKTGIRSEFVVRIHSEEDALGVAALEDKIADVLADRLRRAMLIKEAEDAAKLKKVNFWRKATFRKPLTRLV